MAARQPEYRPVIESRSDMERTPDQVAREDALKHVEETLLNIEQAIRRADVARKSIRAGGSENNLRLCLDTAVERLEAARKELFHTAFFGGDQQRLY
jgi:predicted O-methyltransferase YrrM